MEEFFAHIASSLLLRGLAGCWLARCTEDRSGLTGLIGVACGRHLLSWYGLMVMTFASHAKGSEFDPRYQYVLWLLRSSQAYSDYTQCSHRAGISLSGISLNPVLSSISSKDQNPASEHKTRAHGVECYLRVSIVVSISACHADDPGSIPGRGTFLRVHHWAQVPDRKKSA